MECISIVCLVYMNHGSKDYCALQELKDSRIAKSLLLKLNEIKEYYLKNEIET